MPAAGNGPSFLQFSGCGGLGKHNYLHTLYTIKIKRLQQHKNGADLPMLQARS
jgi:hypothetical protein